jgi:elongator complex protein 3
MVFEEKNNSKQTTTKPFTIDKVMNNNELQQKISSEYIKEFFEELEKKPDINKEEIAKLKIRLCKKHHIKKIPTDIEISIIAPDDLSEKWRLTLQTKPNRSLSGVTPVAIMTSPHPCPHGKCTMCPGGLSSPWGDKPQSYTGAEPATMRGERANWDAYLQVFNRLEQYIVTGHVIDKVDLIVMGGTFTARDKKYQNSFIAYALKAMNDFSELFFDKDNNLLIDKFKEFFELPGNIHTSERTIRIQQKILKIKNKNLPPEENRSVDFKDELLVEQKRNEKTVVRCIGLTIETRPDWGFEREGNNMLEQGCTRVELGIQSVFDDALESVKRGHSVSDNKKSIRILKDLGFKLNFHMMLGLPVINGVSELPDRNKSDSEGLKKLFTDPDFRPDMIKLYPLMVMPGTYLAMQYEKGEFTPMSTEEAVEVISEFLPTVPNYCRVMRVQRDIPTSRTIAGVDKTNLRQFIDRALEKKGLEANDIRARESRRKKIVNEPRYELNVLEYEASGGREFFISIDDVANNAIIGFCRLRFPSQELRSEITPSSALIRELHVYGPSTRIGFDDEKSTQHKGFGKQLLKKAEDICIAHKKNKLLVISGIGVREYYRNLGYVSDGPYVSKRLI